jgi:hypothetical protein
MILTVQNSIKQTHPSQFNSRIFFSVFSQNSLSVSLLPSLCFSLMGNSKKETRNSCSLSFSLSLFLSWPKLSLSSLLFFMFCSKVLLPLLVSSSLSLSLSVQLATREEKFILCLLLYPSISLTLSISFLPRW